MVDQVIRLRDRLNFELKDRIGDMPLPGILPGILGKTCANKTRAPRKSSSLPGYLRVDGKARLINCKITDMSATGACLKIVASDRHIKENIADYPADVTLYIIFDKISVECEIVWRKEEENLLGVQFRAPPRPTC